MLYRRQEHTTLITASIFILAMTAVAFALYYTRPIMIPFVMAIFIVTLVSPLVDIMELKLRIPHAVAVTVTLLLVLTCIVIFFVIMVSLVQSVVATTVKYTESFATLLENALTKVASWGIDIDQEQVVRDFQVSVFRFVTGKIGTVFDALSFVFFVVIFLIFLLPSRHPMSTNTGVYADIDSQVRRYIATKVVISSLTGLLVWISLSLFGLELAGVFGILAFILNFIPNIGSIIATLLPIPIAVAQFSNPWMIIAVIAVPGCIQIVVGNGLEPKMMGNELQLHPVTVLLALAFWGLLWGVVGALLAVPVTAVIRIILMQFETLKPVSNLLAGKLPGFHHKTHRHPVPEINVTPEKDAGEEPT